MTQFKKMALIAIISSLFTASASFAGLSGRDPIAGTQIIPYSSYYEEQGLPPHLMAVFSIDCSEAFVGAVRTDRYDPKSRSIIISLGAQVRPLLTNCSGSSREIVVDAGPTYSGRSFEVRPY